MTVLGPVDEIPLGEGRAYAVGDDMVAVFRLRDGSLRAVSAVCPLHLNAFDLTTGCSTTGQPSLTVYPVHLDTDNHLVLEES